MKVEDSEREWINSRLIFEVEDAKKRSQVQIAARSLANETKDPDNYYWLFVNYFIDSENADDLADALKNVDEISLLENSFDYGKMGKRTGGKRTRK